MVKYFDLRKILNSLKNAVVPKLNVILLIHAIPLFKTHQFRKLLSSVLILQANYTIIHGAFGGTY